MIVFSDLHLSEDSAEVVFQKVLPGILEAAKEDGGVIACLGDFWHVRYKIPVALQNQVVEWLRALKRERLQLYLLPGNHDQINGAGENALEVFADLDHVTVITEPTWNRYGLWIPYRKDKEDIIRALALPAPVIPPQIPTLWMHHGIKGAEMSPGVLSGEGVEPTTLFGWQAVLCGHFHKRQRLGNIVYVGSPYQVTAAEAGQPKGYAIWNAHTGEFYWVDTVWGKRFHNLDLTEQNARDFLQARVALPGDEVRLRGVGAREAEEWVQAFQKTGTHCVAEVALPKVEERLEVGPSPTLESYARAYAQKLLSEAEVDPALAVYREITQP